MRALATAVLAFLLACPTYAGDLEELKTISKEFWVQFDRIQEVARPENMSDGRSDLDVATCEAMLAAEAIVRRRSELIKRVEIVLTAEERFATPLEMWSNSSVEATIFTQTAFLAAYRALYPEFLGKCPA